MVLFQLAMLVYQRVVVHFEKGLTCEHVSSGWETPLLVDDYNGIMWIILILPNIFGIIITQ